MAGAWHAGYGPQSLALPEADSSDVLLPCLLYHTVLHCLQVSTNFLSTRPVLQGLQDMVDVPLANEIVHGKHPQATTYLDQPALKQVFLHLGQLNDADLSCLAMHADRACGVTRCWAR
jgi:hypothetical protein